MSERKEHIVHMKQLTGQKDRLIGQLEQTQTQLSKIKELISKTQGAIEYLEAIGISQSDEEDVKMEETPKENETSKEDLKNIRTSFLPIKT